jgi:hypothetical protein
MNKAAKWQDWASFALGLWLAVSPWIAGYADNEAATANAAFVGTALALGAHFEVGLCEASAEWLNVAVGLWLMGAPFVLGFEAAGVPAANCLAVGSFATALALSALELDKGIGRLLHRRQGLRL